MWLEYWASEIALSSFNSALFMISFGIVCSIKWFKLLSPKKSSIAFSSVDEIPMCLSENFLIF